VNASKTIRDVAKMQIVTLLGLPTLALLLLKNAIYIMYYAFDNHAFLSLSSTASSAVSISRRMVHRLFLDCIIHKVHNTYNRVSKNLNTHPKAPPNRDNEQTVSEIFFAKIVQVKYNKNFSIVVRQNESPINHRRRRHHHLHQDQTLRHSRTPRRHTLQQHH